MNRRVLYLLPVLAVLIIGAVTLLPSQDADAAVSGWYFAYTWHEYDNTYCGEKVWWCDGSVTTQGVLTCPVRKTHTWTCEGGGGEPIP